MGSVALNGPRKRGNFSMKKLHIAHPPDTLKFMVDRNQSEKFDLILRKQFSKGLKKTCKYKYILKIIIAD
jgi:hypothetical protein